MGTHRGRARRLVRAGGVRSGDGSDKKTQGTRRAEARHRGPAHPLGDRGRRGNGSAGAAAVRAVLGEYLPGPVAVRAPQPGPRSRVRVAPVRPPRGRRSRGRPVVRTRTVPAGTGQRMRMAVTGQLHASALGPCPRCTPPVGASSPVGQADTPTGAERTARKLKADKSRHQRGSPRRLRLPSRALSAHACPAAAGSPCRSRLPDTAVARMADYGGNTAAGWLTKIEYLADCDPFYARR